MLIQPPEYASLFHHDPQRRFLDPLSGSAPTVNQVYSGPGLVLRPSPVEICSIASDSCFHECAPSEGLKKTCSSEPVCYRGDFMVKLLQDDDQRAASWNQHVKHDVMSLRRLQAGGDTVLSPHCDPHTHTHTSNTPPRIITHSRTPRVTVCLETS